MFQHVAPLLERFFFRVANPAGDDDDRRSVGISWLLGTTTSIDLERFLQLKKGEGLSDEIAVLLRASD